MTCIYVNYVCITFARMNAMLKEKGTDDKADTF